MTQAESDHESAVDAAVSAAAAFVEPFRGAVRVAEGFETTLYFDVPGATAMQLTWVGIGIREVLAEAGLLDGADGVARVDIDPRARI